MSPFRPEPASVIAFLSVFAIARILIPSFPTDIEGQTHTRTGRVHWVLGIATFGSLAAAAGSFEGTSLDDVVGWVVVGTTVFMIVARCVRRFRRIFGLAERLFYVSMISWFLITGIELVLLAR